MALEREIKTYKSKLPELLAHEGKFVLIHNEELCEEFFESFEDAVTAGYEKFELSPFLVKQIWAVEPVHFVGHV